MHLDIKPENILLLSNNFDDPSSSVVKLIDFGLAQPYRDQMTKVHVKEDSVQDFLGNVGFATEHTMLFMSKFILFMKIQSQAGEMT